MTAPEGFLITSNSSEVRGALAPCRTDGISIGFVPTMGALHAGHLSLIERARRESGRVVVSIFVNPTQFGPTEDLAKYPRPIENDLGLCRDAGVDLVFLPAPGAIYPPGFGTWVEVPGLSSVLEGASRPGHFRGVATVVLKLLQIVGPDTAYFGQKDFQQLAVIRRMVADLNVPADIVTCATVREPDGLALSSRNVYLSSKERKSALGLSESLEVARARIAAGETDLEAVGEAMRAHLQTKPGVAPDYALIADADTLEPLKLPRPRMVALVAAKVGTTRLIDNALLGAD